MIKRSSFFVSLLIFTSSFFAFTGTVFAQEEEISLLKNVAAESESTSETDVDEVYTVKKEWFIYYKKATKVTAGPFNTVEEAIGAWIDNSKIKAKGKYYIGRNGRMYTNDPENYYKKKYESVVREKSLQLAQEQREQKAREEAELASLLKPSSAEENLLLENSETKPESEEVVLSKKEQKAKEKAEKKAEKERLAAEKKAEKERKKKGIPEETIEEIPEDENKEEIIPLSDSSSDSESQVEAFVFQTETIQTNENFSLDFTIQNDPFSGSRYSKSYLSDFIAKDIFAIPENSESDIESDFIEFSDQPDSKGVTLLMKAVREGNDWKIRTLIGSGSDVNAKDKDGWTPLMYAVRYQNNVSVVEQLLSQKADVKAQNNYSLSALVLASCFNDNPDIIKKLLSYYSPSDKEVQKAFVQLISTQQTDNFALISKIKLFLDFGLPVNSYYDGKTPLMYACKYCTTTKAVKLLLDKNAAVSVRSTEGKTAFDYAQENKALPKDDIYWSLNKK